MPRLWRMPYPPTTQFRNDLVHNCVRLLHSPTNYMPTRMRYIIQARAHGLVTCMQKFPELAGLNSMEPTSFTTPVIYLCFHKSQGQHRMYVGSTTTSLLDRMMTHLRVACQISRASRVFSNGCTWWLFICVTPYQQWYMVFMLAHLQLHAHGELSLLNFC